MSIGLCSCVDHYGLMLLDMGYGRPDMIDDMGRDE